MSVADLGPSTLFSGPGELRALCRAFRWSDSPLGGVEGWPSSLRAAVRICLDSCSPTAVAAGADLALIYNDAYAALLGPERHPAALGRPMREVWGDLWARLGPELAGVVQHGQCAFRRNECFMGAKSGHEEELFLTYSFIPIKEEGGDVVGVLGFWEDTTESVQTFHQRSALLRAISDTSEERIFAKDLSGRVTFANPAALAMVGRPAEEVLGRTDVEILQDEAVGRRLMENDRAVLELGKAMEFEETLISSDGRPGVWLSLKAPYRDDSGRVIGVFGVARDITERKRTEGELRESEQRLRLLIEYTPAAVAMFDREMRYLAASQRFISDYGLPKNVLNKSHYEIFPEVPERWKEIHRRCLAGAVERCDEDPFPRADGTLDWVRWEIHPWRTETGDIGGIVLFAEKITDRKRAEIALRESEERYSAIHDHAPFAIALTKPPEDTVLSVNQAFLTMFECSREEAVGRNAVALGLTGAETEPDVAAELGRGGVVRGLEVTRPTKSNSERILSINIDPVTIGGQKLILRTIEDVTERKRAESALRAANEQLREADRRKTEFLAMLSHELRNPLAPIANSLYILGRVPPGAEQGKRAQEVIARQVSHMSRLIEDLLDVTRITRGKIQLQRTRLDVNELAFRTVEDHRSMFEKNGIELRLRLAPVEAWVYGDRTRLAQALGNLLQNAAKFTPRGGSTTVCIEPDLSAGRVTLSVSDTGAGIAPEVMPHLFEAFTQAETSLDRSKGGLGLGLALVKGLVQMHGGSVSGSSGGPGQGAVFTISLPLLSAAPSTTRVERESGGGPRRRVLVIEDNVDAADSLRDAIELDGHIVQTAHTGPEGLEKARAFAPDVILCDIGLPGMDGYAVARAVRADPELARVMLLALSGYAQPEDVARARQAGFDAHLAKPPSMQVLERALAGAPAHSAG